MHIPRLGIHVGILAALCIAAGSASAQKQPARPKLPAQAAKPTKPKQGAHPRRPAPLPSGAIARPCRDPRMLDDFEDGDASICANSGRVGGWYFGGDQSAGSSSSPADGATLTSANLVGGRGRNSKALSYRGRGFTDWGAFVGLWAVTHDGKAIDASQYQGFRLRARSVGAPRQARVMVTTADLIEPQFDGTCAKDCYDYYGQDVTLSSSWQNIQIPFSAMKQQGWGVQKRLDLRQVRGFQLNLPNPPAADFNVEIDEVAFY